MAALFPTPSSLDNGNLERVHALTRERIENSRSQVERLAQEIRQDEKDGKMIRVDDGMKVSHSFSLGGLTRRESTRMEKGNEL